MFVKIDDKKERDNNITIVNGLVNNITHIKTNQTSNKKWYRIEIGVEECQSKCDVFKSILNKTHQTSVVISTHLDIKRNDRLILVGNVESFQGKEGGRKFYSLNSIIGYKKMPTYKEVEGFFSLAFENISETKRLYNEFEKNSNNPLDLLFSIGNAEKNDLPKTDGILLDTLKSSLVNEESLMYALLKPKLLEYFPNKDSIINRIIDKYKFNAIEELKKNPWDFYLTIPYMKVEYCDYAADVLNIPCTDDRRTKTLITKVFQNYIKQSKSTIVSFEVTSIIYSNYFKDMYSKNEFNDALTDNTYFVKLKNGYQPYKLYIAEKEIYDYCNNITNSSLELTADELNEIVLNIERQIGITYEKEQRDAIKTSLTSNLTLITGGPGTGKTTTLSGIVKALKSTYGFSDFEFLLLAPTGKAAQRMNSQLGMSTMTIHSALGIRPNSLSRRATLEAISNYKSSDYKPKVIIVDECSMLNTEVAGELFFVTKELDCKLILLGDVNQLPSIEAGDVYSDLLENNEHIKLETVKRQADGSPIIELSNEIMNNNFPDANWFDSKHDVKFISGTQGTLNEIIKNLFKEIDPNTAQILTPYSNIKKDEFGRVINHNDIAQLMNKNLRENFVNTEDSYKIREDLSVSTGDRLLFTRNLNKKLINGTVCRLIYVDNSASDREDYNLIVDCDPNVLYKSIEQLGDNLQYVAEIPYEAWDDVLYGYAMTIHKSQGSEYDTVIVPILRNGFGDFLNKNLLYTAITRARKQVIIIGSEEILKSIANTNRPSRNTGLQQLFLSNR